MSSREKTGPLIRVSIIGIGSIGQLRLVLPIIMFNCRAYRIIFSDSSFFESNNRIYKCFPRSEGTWVYMCRNIEMCQNFK